MKARIAIFILLILSGCAKDPRHDLQILNEYKIGASREQLVARLTTIDAQCVESKSRPTDGWPELTKKTASGAIRAAHQFEQQNPGLIVQLSEVYWVWRHYDYASAFSTPGVWYDYLLFDKENKLLGHLRVFAD